MTLISSFWSQPLWARELPPTHGSRFSHFSLTSGACHRVLQPLPGSTKILETQCGSTGLEPDQSRQMHRQLLLCDLRPPAFPLWATLWRTCLPRARSPYLNQGISCLDCHQRHK